jgi:KaiC/GvpD/RAD55 family RecA-like ATPase
MIQSENYMTIIGGPGSGKTATARHKFIQDIRVSDCCLTPNQQFFTFFMARTS